jgi:hypothetical protein
MNVSLFSWLFSKPTPPQSTGLPNDGLTAPPPRALAPALASANTLADLKQQRHERREHLYSVVRSVMLRSEVLASNYKFKVLSLDTRGRQFLIMVDLSGEQALHPDRWAPVEQLIAMTAAQRHDLMVKAVYWRVAEVPANLSAPQPAAHVQAPTARPAVEPVALPARPAVTSSRADNFDPIDNDEMLAFKKAISAATPDDLPVAGKVVTSGPRHNVVLTGYEDTQLLEPDDAASPLSRTQFGALN